MRTDGPREQGGDVYVLGGETSEERRQGGAPTIAKPVGEAGEPRDENLRQACRAPLPNGS